MLCVVHTYITDTLKCSEIHIYIVTYMYTLSLIVNMPLLYERCYEDTHTHIRRYNAVPVLFTNLFELSGKMTNRNSFYVLCVCA